MSHVNINTSDIFTGKNNLIHLVFLVRFKKNSMLELQKINIHVINIYVAIVFDIGEESKKMSIKWCRQNLLKCNKINQ